MAAPQPAAGPVRFIVLGPLSITDGTTTAVLPSSKPSALLATLLLHANTVVPVPYLQRAIWGEEPPETAKAAVQSCVLRLRRLFGKYGVPTGVIESVSDGYRINADTQTLDLLRYRELRTQAAATERLSDERDLLRQAVRLWRGTSLLGNVNSDLLHRDQVPRLDEERLQAVERIFDIELALGRCREVLAENVTMTRSHPAHERFWEQLIEALYRTGRRAEALAEYRRVKNHLLDELGIDPGPSLQRLELAILRGESLEPAPPGRPVPELAGPARPGDGVLDLLLRAGLLEQGPHGDYRMNDLLHAFTRAAAGEHHAAPALQGAFARQPTGTR
jgi:DNA-binding SARP family transcriptional activator